MKKTGFYLLSVSMLLSCECEKTDASTQCDRFVAAMVDASRELTADDVYDGLVSLAYGVSSLVEWTIAGDDTLLLVATLQCIDWEYARVGVGETVVTDSSADNVIWVAIPGELADKLQQDSVITDSLTLNNRLLEILGLRPDGAESVVNLFWVDKNSLLRPSYNPDNTTTFGSIDYPADDTLPSWYKEWFVESVAYSYESPQEGLNYPFTRLGYTYDWGEGKSKYGVSEFITVPLSAITVERSVDCWSYYNEIIAEKLD